MNELKKLILALGLLGGISLGNEAIACTPGQGPAGDPNCRGPIESSGWYGNNNGGGEAPVYVPPKVIILPDSWGAIAMGSKNIGVASKQASKQATCFTKL